EQYQICEETIPPFQDVPVFFALMARMKLSPFVVSSARQDRLEHWFHGYDLHKECGQIFSSRDKTSAMLEACRRLRVEPLRTCYVGDLGIDMRAAREAGMTAIGMTRGYGTGKALLECGATLVVENFTQLSSRLVY